MTRTVPAPYQRIVPAIWFDHDALDGARFHVEAFRTALGDLSGDEASTGLVTVTHYPEAEELPDFQKPFAGAPLEVRYRLCGLELSDINSDDAFALSPAMSVSVALDAGLVPDAAERVTALHAALLADDGSRPADQRGESALRTWVETISRLFPDEDTHLGALAHYQREGSDEADALLHGSAVLAGLPVQAMDNGGAQDFGFSCAASFMVLAETQDQVDGLFDALSTDPGTEVCGWMVDPVGFSWQTGPADLGELMDVPGAYGVMIARPRPVLADYEPLRARRAERPVA